MSINNKSKGKLTIQWDEEWSVVVSKGNQKWIWLALDLNPREYGEKVPGQTSYIERFNNPPPKIASRQVRNTLSLFKKLENHIDTIASLAENLKAQRKQIGRAMRELTSDLHQAELLLQNNKDNVAAELIREAIHECEALTLII
ncbi:MAG: hypothetical protein AB4426_20440 [Xenococcaceae cyanobacterium]